MIRLFLEKTGRKGDKTVGKFLEQSFVMSGSTFYNLYHNLKPKDSDYDWFFRSLLSLRDFENFFEKISVPLEAAGGSYTDNSSSPNNLANDVLWKCKHSYLIKMPPIIPVANLCFRHLKFPKEKTPSSLLSFIRFHDFLHTQFSYYQDDLQISKMSLACVEQKLLLVNPLYVEMLREMIENSEGSFEIREETIDEITQHITRYNKFVQRGMKPTKDTAKFLDEMLDARETLQVTL